MDDGSSMRMSCVRTVGDDEGPRDPLWLQRLEVRRGVKVGYDPAKEDVVSSEESAGLDP